MTTKFTDADGKTVYTDAPHELETGHFDAETETRPWFNLWLGACVTGDHNDDLMPVQRMEMLWAPVRVEVLS